MLASLLNSVTGWYIKRGMRGYHIYPTDKTAVVFINAQNAFLKDSPVLTRKLTSLAKLARAKQYLVIHAPMSATSAVRFPTTAHLEMTRLLSTSCDGPEIASAVGPHESDVVLPARSTLSVYGEPAIDGLIEARGLEHLILAGPLANWTVDSSLRDAVQRDCHVTILSDCIAATTEAALNLELQYTMPRYAHLVTDLQEFSNLTSR